MTSNQLLLIANYSGRQLNTTLANLDGNQRVLNSSTKYMAPQSTYPTNWTDANTTLSIVYSGYTTLVLSSKKFGSSTPLNTIVNNGGDGEDSEYKYITVGVLKYGQPTFFDNYGRDITSSFLASGYSYILIKPLSQETQLTRLVNRVENLDGSLLSSFINLFTGGGGGMSWFLIILAILLIILVVVGIIFAMKKIKKSG